MDKNLQPKVLVIIECGDVRVIVNDPDIKVVTIDYDAKDKKYFQDLGGEKCFVHDRTEVDPEVVEDHLKVLGYTGANLE